MIRRRADGHSHSSPTAHAPDAKLVVYVGAAAAVAAAAVAAVCDHTIPQHSSFPGRPRPLRRWSWARSDADDDHDDYNDHDDYGDHDDDDD